MKRLDEFKKRKGAAPENPEEVNETPLSTAPRIRGSASSHAPAASGTKGVGERRSEEATGGGGEGEGATSEGRAEEQGDRENKVRPAPSS